MTLIAAGAEGTAVDREKGTALITIAYATESGNAAGVAASAERYANSLGVTTAVIDLAATSPDELSSCQTLLIVAATSGEGDAPERSKPFLRRIESESAPSFEGTRYAVLALGDLAYPNFCGHGERLDLRLSELGGSRALALVRCDFDYEADARKWISAAVGALGLESAAEAMPVDDLQIPGVEVAAELVGRTVLSGHGALRRSVHLTLAFDESVAFSPGDLVLFTPQNDPAVVMDLLEAAGLGQHDAMVSGLLALDVTTVTERHISLLADRSRNPSLVALAADQDAIARYVDTHRLSDLLRTVSLAWDSTELLMMLRPLAPRSFSIASSPEDARDRVDLLISETTWHTDSGRRFGVASSDLIERRALGSRFTVRVKPNLHFHLPDDGVPMILVGGGSGVAPFRGFVRDRRARRAPGPVWLVFGHRTAAHDFLYEDEWAGGGDPVLQRFDAVFSRDTDPAEYVQHRLEANRDDVSAWIAAGAMLYVCGTRPMSEDVDRALDRILGPSGGSAAALSAEGRLHRDIY